MGDRHMAGGMAGWLVVAPLMQTPGPLVLAGLPLAAVAALVADTDHPPSRMGRNFLARWLVQPWTEHRKETHSIVFALLVSAPFVFAGWWAAAAVASGYLIGHIFLDWSTRQGVALLWPFTRRMYRAPWARFIRTGGASEYILVTLMLIPWIWWVFFA